MRSLTNDRTPEPEERSTTSSGWRTGTQSEPSFNASAPEITTQLADIAVQLEEVDSRSARRLDDLARAISNEHERQRWSDVDLRRAFNTDRLAHSFAVEHEGGYAPKRIELADKLRNVLVLVPILLTWYAIGAAVSNHAKFVEMDPENNLGIPFLVAWEQGFGGQASWLAPSLSHVAYIDAILIAIIIGLTLYAHGRREEQEDNIADTASLFQAEIDNALAEAGVLLATDRSSRPVRLADAVESMADAFELSSQALLTQLQVEHDRMEMLSSRREKEFTDFGVFASGMRSGAEEMHRILASLRDVSHGLERSLQDLASDLAQSSEQQRSLLTAVTNLERLTSSAIQNDLAATRQLAQTASRLEETADKAITGAEQTAQAGRIAMDAMRSVAEITRDISASQLRIDEVLSAQNSASTQLTESLRAADTANGQTARTLADIGNGLVTLQREFSIAGQQNAQQIQTLNAVLKKQVESGQDLSGMVHEISGVAMSTAQRQREVSDSVQHLVQRLDTLANTLNHLIAQQPGSIRADRTDPDEADSSSSTPAPARWSRTRS